MSQIVSPLRNMHLPPQGDGGETHTYTVEAFTVRVATWVAMMYLVPNLQILSNLLVYDGHADRAAHKALTYFYH